MDDNGSGGGSGGGGSGGDGGTGFGSGTGTGGSGGSGEREYRVEELAKAAGIPVRTLRFYRERRLLPPPRRDGRIAWYSEAHLARLRTIAGLLERGHTLGGIAELIAAWENGRTLGGVAELLGLEGALTAPWSEETPVRLTPEQLADYFGGDVTPENLTSALNIGYIGVDGENVIHISRRLLDASAALVHEGVPLAAVLAAGRGVREHVDALADLFTQVIRTHVIGPMDDLPPAEAHRIAESLQRLRPLAKNIVDAEMGLAMERRVRAEIDAWLRQQAERAEAGTGPNTGTGTGTGTGTEPVAETGPVAETVAGTVTETRTGPAERTGGA